MSSDYNLAYGTHATPDDGRCAMEWVSYLAGEDHSDEPACVSPVLRAFCIALNDGLEDGPRQRLRPYLTRTIGTAGDGLDRARAWMAMDWLIRVYTPAWMDLAGLHADRDALVALPPIAEPRSLRPALVAVEVARERARGERARVFAESPSGWASALTAGLAGRESAWGCAGAAAWAAARVGVGDLAGDRARAAARTAAGDAAAIGVRRARPDNGASRSAAREAARGVIAPTLATLADSAVQLLDRMLPTEELIETLPPSRGDAPAVLLVS